MAECWSFTQVMRKRQLQNIEAFKEQKKPRKLEPELSRCEEDNSKQCGPSAVALPAWLEAKSAMPLAADLPTLLQTAFSRSKLDHHLPAALAWVDEMGALHWDELLEEVDDFVQAMGLDKLEEQHLRETTAELIIQGGWYVGIGKLWKARSRLYRRRCSQVNTHFPSFSSICRYLQDMHTVAPLSPENRRFF